MTPELDLDSESRAVNKPRPGDRIVATYRTWRHTHPAAEIRCRPTED